jgi:hypothetical protein
LLLTLLLVTLTSQSLLNATEVLSSNRFTITIQYAARSNERLSNSAFAIKWNGVIIDEVFPSDNNVNTITLTVTAVVGSNSLGLAGLGRHYYEHRHGGASIQSLSLVQQGTVKNIIVGLGPFNDNFYQAFILDSYYNLFKSYILSVVYAARAGIALNSSSLIASWNGVQLAAINSVDYNLHNVSWTVNGIAGNNVLQFAGAGTSDGYGITITNVTLVLVGGTTNLIVNGNFQQGRTPGSYHIYTNNQITGWIPSP